MSPAFDDEFIETCILSGTRAEAPPGTPEADRTVRSDALREFLEKNRTKIPWQGFRIKGFVLEGDVNFEHLAWQGLIAIVDCEIRGDLKLSYARITGRILLDDSTISGQLAIRHAVVDGNVSAARVVAVRGIAGLGVKITGALSLQKAVLTAPSEDAYSSNAALDIYRATLGDLFLNGAELNGGLYAIGAKIDRNIRLQGVVARPRSFLGWKQSSDAGDGVDLASAIVGGSIYLRNSETNFLRVEGGTVNLTGVQCTNLYVSTEQLRNLKLNIDRMAYRSLSPASGGDLLAKLERDEKFQPGAYSGLAKYAADNGDELLSRRVRVRHQARLTRRSSWYTFHSLGRRALGFLVGYGYRPARAIVALVGCILASTIVLRFHPRFVVPAKGGTHQFQGWWDAAVLSVDQMVPLSGLGFKEQWQFVLTSTYDSTWFSVLIFLKILSWILSALALASVTGIIRKVS